MKRCFGWAPTSLRISRASDQVAANGFSNDVAAGVEGFADVLDATTRWRHDDDQIGLRFVQRVVEVGEG